ncbi:MAG: hypothetical protein WA160_03300 [Pseudobdellovibrio sp.]
MSLKHLASFYKFLIYVAVSILTSCSVAELNLANETVGKSEDNYIASCYIMNSKFEIVRHLSSHWVCMPRADGGWVAAGNNEIVNYNPEGVILWKKSGDYHHQIKQLNSNAIVVLIAEAKKIKIKPIKFDSVQILNLENGQLIHEFSIYEEIFKTESLKGSHLDHRVFEEISDDIIKKKNLDFKSTHLNSISFYKNEIIVNDLGRTLFALDRKLKFKHFYKFPEIHGVDKLLWGHDFQRFDNGNFLFFNNFNSKLNTFKIFEFEDNKIVFEFPQKKEDYFSVFCCGGAEKIEKQYLIGFPGTDANENISVVGLVSAEGNWIVRKILPIRIQDIKKIPYADYLIKNKIR